MAVRRASQCFAYDAPYLIDVAHPDVEAMGVDISKPVRLSRELAEYFDLYVQVKQCCSFLAVLPSHHRQPQEMIHHSSELRAKQVPLKLGNWCSTVCVEVFSSSSLASRFKCTSLTPTYSLHLPRYCFRNDWARTSPAACTARNPNAHPCGLPCLHES